MAKEHDRARTFVSRLLANPALGPLTPLQREEQIIQFLHVNAAALAPTLSTPGFFPGASWSQSLSLLLSALVEEVDVTLMPRLEEILARMQFGFVALLRPQSSGGERVRDQIREYLRGVLRRMDARRVMTGPLAAVSYGFVDRYCDQMWARKGYSHFELTKVQRLRLGREEIKAMIEATLLLKPIVCSGSSATAGLAEHASGVVQAQYAERVVAAAREALSLAPEELIRSAANASVSFQENRYIEATARMAAILSWRCRSYQPNMRADRGADSPDKSWLSVARRNYRFYGFDVKMIDELYSIAAENGW